MHAQTYDPFSFSPTIDAIALIALSDKSYLLDDQRATTGPQDRKSPLFRVGKGQLRCHLHQELEVPFPDVLK